MQTSEEGIQQTELKSSPNNPFKNPQQVLQQPQQAYQQQQYRSESVDSGKGGEDKFKSWGNFKTWMIRWRGSRRLVLVIVAIALLLDNMLLTVVGELNVECATSQKKKNFSTQNFRSRVRAKAKVIAWQIANALCYLLLIVIDDKLPPDRLNSI